MKRYPVGTRVRVIAAKEYPHLVGSEGVIVGDAPSRITRLAGEVCYTIDIPLHIAPDGTTEWFGPQGSLEPILNEYDGNETTTWDECPWKPEGVKV